MKKRILIAGEGGQGIQTIAKIFSKSCFESNIPCSYIPSFGVEQRGTPSIAYLVISENTDNHHPKFDIADYVLVLSERSIKHIKKYISPNTEVFFDSSTISASSLPANAINISASPFTQYATEQFKPKMVNLLSLGYLAKEFCVPIKNIEANAILAIGGKVDKGIIAKAVNFGHGVLPEKEDFSKAKFKMCHNSIIFKGNDKTAEIVPKRCKGCGICILKCPAGAIKFGSELGIYSNPVPEIDLEKCLACQNCFNFCPDGAIRVVKNLKRSS